MQVKELSVAALCHAAALRAAFNELMPFSCNGISFTNETDFCFGPLIWFYSAEDLLDGVPFSDS